MDWMRTWIWWNAEWKKENQFVLNFQQFHRAFGLMECINRLFIIHT